MLSPMTRTTLLITILLIATLEITLRFLGVQTWNIGKDQQDRGWMFESDQLLGWNNKPGKYKFNLTDENMTLVTVTNDADASRKNTFNKTLSRLPLVAFVGGSFTYGWEVSDSETFLWKLQGKTTNLLIKNFAVPGHSGYQSLIKARQIFKLYPQTKYLIYGYCDFHKPRNIADWKYFRGTVQNSARRNISPSSILMPYAEIDAAGKFIEQRPSPYTYVSLGRYSAIVRAIEDVVNKFQSDKREKNKIVIELKIIEKMNELAKEHNAQFVLLNLVSDFEDKKYLIPELEKRSIKNIDCDSGGREYETYLREGVTHPNGKWHDKVAECIKSKLGL